MKVTPIIVHIEGNDGPEVLAHYADRQSGMLLCECGCAEFAAGVRRYDVRSADMLIIIPFTNLVLTYLSPDFRGILCIVDLDFVFSAITPVNLSSNLQFIISHPLSHPSPSDMADMISLIRLLEQRKRFGGERPLTAIMVENLVYALADMVLDSYLNVNQMETRSSDAKESIMLAFHADLSRDFATERKVSHYARLQNLTPRYFSTAVKAISGFTPLYWINTAVAAEAKRLMRNSNASIKEIAYELNFASPTFFTRWYREFTGETPSQYRTRCRITLANRS